MTFVEQWLAAVDRKNSVLCAGLDPAEYGMGRGSAGLPEGVAKRDWALRYVKSVLPHVAAVKPNNNYWKGPGDRETLIEVAQLVEDGGAVYIDDSKLADIDDTNESGFYHSRQGGFHAVTVAPFAGNTKQAAEQAAKWGMGAIVMCLMSNPGYEAEKEKFYSLESLRKLDASLKFDPKDLVVMEKSPLAIKTEAFVPQYIVLANQAEAYDMTGVVIGAPSKKNHITSEEIEAARRYLTNKRLVLLPGVGAQGGEAGIIWKYFGPQNVIVNVGRGIMFPKEADFEKVEVSERPKSLGHGDVTEYYQRTLNNLRKAA